MKNNMDSIVNRVIIAANYSDLKVVDSIMHEGQFIPCKNGFLVSQTLDANRTKTVGQLLKDINKFMQNASEYRISVYTDNYRVLQYDKKDIIISKSIRDCKQIKKVLSE